ncbi:(2Fe-2S)-binding protein [Halobacteriales archaeon QS_5_70_17]|nr:MAG: (2Fe-2S)-binding protein [Halobacteriales archaeon QS_5_70_17]
MRDGPRVSVAANGERETARVHDDEGEVEVGGATFSFSVSGAGGDGEEESTDEDGGETPHAEDPLRIAPLEDVPTDSTIRCEALDGDRGIEVILRRDGDAVLAWCNSCPHQPEVRLDPGWGAMVRGGEIVCHEHGARFDPERDGVCTYGPCRGRTLEAVLVEVRDGTVYLDDDRFDRCRRLS